VKKVVFVLLILCAAAALAQESENNRVLAKLKNQIVTINFSETPLVEAVHFFQDITGLKFVTSKISETDITVSLRLREMRLENALHFVLVPNGLDYIVKEGAVHVVTAEEPDKLRGGPIRHELPDMKPDHVLLLLEDGSRIEGKVSLDKWKLKTAYGELAIPANEIRGITLARQTPEGFVDEVETVRFSLTGRLGFDKLEIDTGKGKLTVPKEDIKKILFQKTLADKTFDVKATGEWLDTGIFLGEGSGVKIETTGELTFSNAQDESEIIMFPDGAMASASKRDKEWKAPEWYAEEFPLLVRVGKNQKSFQPYMSEGKYSCKFRVTRKGTLFLKVSIPESAGEAAKTFKGAYKTKVTVEK
jgi:hypothetical protein